MTSFGDTTQAPATGVRANPFVGPRSIRYGEALFGRDRELTDLCSTLVAARIVLLYSVSGAGKSSLVEAGLRPELERRRFALFPTIRVGQDLSHLYHGTVRNRYTLSALLSLEEGRPVEARFQPSTLAEMTLVDYLPLLLAERGEPADPCLLFDQFEELFTLDPVDGSTKRVFLEDVGLALRDPGRWALFSMREEYIAQLDPFRSLIPDRLERRARLELLGPDAARKAMEGPATNSGLPFARDAADVLIDDLRKVRVQDGTGVREELGPSVEPVQLQVVCRELWERVAPQATSIEKSDVTALGDVDDSLARFYEQVIAATSLQSRVSIYFLRRWFSNVLVTPFGTRSMALRGPTTTEDLPNAAVDVLEALHLVRAESRAGAAWYELTHDRFIGPIQASNARALRYQSNALWGLVPLIASVVVAVVLGWYGPYEGWPAAVLHVACASLAGLGLGQLTAAALDRDARRPLPKRARRGWRLAAGVVLLGQAGLLLAAAIGAAVSIPESPPYGSFSREISYVTGGQVTVYVSCTGSSTSVFLRSPEAHTFYYDSLFRSDEIPTELRPILDRLAREWCLSEARANILVMDVLIAMSVGVVTVVLVTWHRRRQRRFVAVTPSTSLVDRPRSDRRRTHRSGGSDERSATLSQAAVRP